MTLSLPGHVRPARLCRLPRGTVIFRNHHRDFPGASFNPCIGAPTRFAPLHRPDGTCLPTFYAATTFDGAAYETVFRGTPGAYSAVPRQDLDRRGVTTLELNRDLELVPLFTPELRKLGLAADEVFRPSERVYSACRALALMAWRDNPPAHGLVWTSVRDNAAWAMLFFGDRLSAEDFTVRATRDIATDASLLDDFIAAAARAGFQISR